MILFMDSFDTYSSGIDDSTYIISPGVDSTDNYSDIRSKWNTVSCPVIVPGRTGYGVKFGTYNTFGLMKTLPTEYYELSCGAAIKYPESFSNALYIFGGANCAIRLVNVNDGRLYVNGGWNYTTLQTDPFNFRMLMETWYFIEFKVIVSPTSFYYKVDVNGETIGQGNLSGFPVPWDNTNNKINTLSITGPGGGYWAVIDDFYLATGEFYGDHKIYVKRTNGDAEFLQWNPNPGPTHYNMLSDIISDKDDSYIWTNQVDKIDLLELENIANPDSISAVQFGFLSKKNRDSELKLIQVYEQDITYEESTIEFSPSTLDYAYHLLVKDKDLNSEDWTNESVSKVKLGVKTSSVVEV